MELVWERKRGCSGVAGPVGLSGTLEWEKEERGLRVGFGVEVG